MKVVRLSWVVPLVVAGAAWTGCNKPAKAGCTKDTDCKGDRICVSGTCREPHPERKPDSPQPVGAAAQPPMGPPTASRVPSARPNVPGMAPGSGLPGQGGTGLGPGLQIKVCSSGRCKTFGPGSGPASLMSLMDLFMQMGMGGMGMGGVPQDLKVEVCTKGRCVTIGKDFGKDPADVMRLMDLVMNMMSGMGMGGPGALFGMPGGPGGRAGSPGFGAPPPPGPGAAPPSPVQGSVPKKVSYRSLDALRKAGPAARGKVAELSGLTPSSVSPGRVVFVAGGGGVLIILKPSNAEQVKRLQTKTGKLTVRFLVRSLVGGSLIQGTLLSFQ